MSWQAKCAGVYGIDKPHIWRERGVWWTFQMGVRRGPLSWDEVKP